MDLVRLDRRRVALLTSVAAAAWLAAGAGMTYVAGPHAVLERFQHPDLPWLALVVGGVVASFVGYALAYHALGHVPGGPREVDLRTRLSLVAAGFGGFLAHGGGAVDRYGAEAAGASEREASVRVTLIDGLEHGVLSIPCSVAAIVLLATGARKPALDFLWSWAVLPALGFAFGFWAADRWRDTFRDRDGWRGKLGVLYDAIHEIRGMFVRPRRHGLELLGMLVFWLGSMAALWAALALFRFHMNVGAAVVAVGTGMIVTRRTGPLGGAGIIECALPPTLWVCGAPWAAAVPATLVYRFLSLWATLPLSLAALPLLRRLGEDAGAARVDDPGLSAG